MSFTDHLPGGKRNFTPLPDELIEKRHHNVKALFLYFLVLVVLGGAVAGAWYVYYFYTTPLVQINSSPDDSLTIIPPKNPQASSSALIDTTLGIPGNWTKEQSETCGLIIPIPLPEEPYIIPRDPNTSPSGTDDEGKHWIVEEYQTSLFMLKYLTRAIFKNPEIADHGYVSSAVEVYCADNSQQFTTEALFTQMQSDLLENDSAVKLGGVGGARIWGKEVRTATFQGGIFGEDLYYIFATKSHIYMIRAFGDSANQDVQAVRDQIFQNLQFAE